MAQLESTAQIDHATVPCDTVILRKAIEDILNSVPFRTSKQCQDMLRYVVERSLTHEQESLRERVIGVAVFGRRPDYDTSEDPVVRVRAADVRKRLAQYYQCSEHHGVPIRIEIPPGSYRATFETLPRENIAQSAKHSDALEIARVKVTEMTELAEVAGSNSSAGSPRRTRTVTWIVTLLVAVSLLAWMSVKAFDRFPPNPLEVFWSPVLGSSRPVLIYTGTNAAYRFSSGFLDQYRKNHHIENQGPEFFVNLSAGEKIDSNDLVPAKDTFITTDDAQASSDIQLLLAHYRRTSDLRYGSDIAVSDLQESPTILIGAFNNIWTLDLTSPLRFIFRDGTRVEDTSGKTKGWSEVTLPDGNIQDDYAVISRLLDPQTGRVLITLAGIGGFGTQAAAAFVTNPLRMRMLEAAAPAGWQKKNMQVVLHVKVRNKTLDEVSVVATQYW